jgi:molybdopterin molybdotransferase
MVTYDEAIVKLKEAAQKVRGSGRYDRQREYIPLIHSVGRIAAEDCSSPISTPEHDTSAMDGYAVRSEATRGASAETPVVFQIVGTIAAGDDYKAVQPMSRLTSNGSLELELEPEPCVEIMTGGRFPGRGHALQMLDACIKVEDVKRLDSSRYISITKPVAPNTHRRLAGNDLQKSQILLHAGHRIQPFHLMPLASVGIETVCVARKPRTAICSTGKELTPLAGSPSRDVNGPFLMAACRAMGAETSFLGVVDDDLGAMERWLERQLDEVGDDDGDELDVLLTSGGVSAGKFDFVHRAINSVAGSQIIFHGLDIRPGHPVLFALLPRPRRVGSPVAFFGLPGNPGAAAACFQFLVVPYLRFLTGRQAERPFAAKIAVTRDAPVNGQEKPSLTMRYFSRQRWDAFRPGNLRVTGTGEAVVEVNQDQRSPAKLWPFVDANCFVHIERDREVWPGDIVSCFPISSDPVF